jgi:hypothetical protein
MIKNYSINQISKFHRGNMKLKFYILCFLIIGCASTNIAQEKLAQTGMPFLSVISDARASALGGSVTGRELQSGSLFFNPAAMGFDTSMFNASFSRNEWIADITHQNFSLSFSPSDGDYGVFGVSLQLVDYGLIEGTIVADNEQGYLDIGNISANAFAAGIGYAKMLSDKFSVGGQVKLVRQSLGETLIPVDSVNFDKAENKLSVLAFDFGTLYKTGFKSLTFGMSVRNFSKEVKYVVEGFQLPLTFSIGVIMDLNDLYNVGDEHSFLFSVDAIHTRSAAGQVGLGLEYSFLNHFFLRGSYITNNSENEYNLGAGVAWYGVQFDYAFSPYGVFGDIQRLTVRFSY